MDKNTLTIDDIKNAQGQWFGYMKSYFGRIDAAYIKLFGHRGTYYAAEDQKRLLEPDFSPDTLCKKQNPRPWATDALTLSTRCMERYAQSKTPSVRWLAQVVETVGHDSFFADVEFVKDGRKIMDFLRNGRSQLFKCDVCNYLAVYTLPDEHPYYRSLPKFWRNLENCKANTIEELEYVIKSERFNAVLAGNQKQKVNTHVEVARSEGDCEVRRIVEQRSFVYVLGSRGQDVVADRGLL